jgi:hypothetical protein
VFTARYVLPTQCIYVFCVDLKTNSDYFTECVYCAVRIDTLNGNEVNFNLEKVSFKADDKNMLTTSCKALRSILILSPHPCLCAVF